VIATHQHRSKEGLLTGVVDINGPDWRGL